MMSKSSKLRYVVRIPEYLAQKGIQVLYRKRFRCFAPGHIDKHPSCTVYRNEYGDHFVCHACGVCGDIFALIGILENLPDKYDQYKFLMKKYGHLI